MKSVTDRLIFRHSSCSELAPTGFSIRADHELARYPARIALELLQKGTTTSPSQMARYDTRTWFNRVGQFLKTRETEGVSVTFKVRAPKMSKTTPCKVAGGRHGCSENKLTRRANHWHFFTIPQS
jgi:hypothetical protein